MSEARNARVETAACRPSPLACVECRKKHLKCDGQQPTCNRCAAGNLHCSFVPSGRGYRGPRKRPADFDDANSRLSPPLSLESNNGSSMPRQPSRWQSPQDSRFAAPQSYDSETRHADAAITIPFSLAGAYETGLEDQFLQGLLPCQSDPDSSYDIDDEQLVAFYYRDFHAAHPVLLPRMSYSTQIYPLYLRLVVQFIGSHYSTSVSSDALLTITAKKLADKQFQNTHHGASTSTVLDSITRSERGQRSPNYACASSRPCTRAWSQPEKLRY